LANDMRMPLHSQLPIFATWTSVCFTSWVAAGTPFCYSLPRDPRALHSFPTRRSSDLRSNRCKSPRSRNFISAREDSVMLRKASRSEEHTSELQSRENLVCRLLLEKTKTVTPNVQTTRSSSGPRQADT